MLGEVVPGPVALTWIVGANLVAIPLFERCLFPAALPWVAVGLGAPLKWGTYWAQIAGSLYAKAAEQLLVAIESIRYIDGV